MYLALEGGPPSFRQDFSCPALLRIPVTQTPHVYGTLTLCGGSSQTLRLRLFALIQVLQPRDIATTVWAVPLSLATTRGILSFPRANEMFQFARFPLFRVMGYDPHRVSPFGHLRLVTAAHA